jgi:hypothetical protein
MSNQRGPPRSMGRSLSFPRRRSGLLENSDTTPAYWRSMSIACQRDDDFDIEQQEYGLRLARVMGTGPGPTPTAEGSRSAPVQTGQDRR